MDTETNKEVPINYKEIIKNTIIIGVISLVIGLILLLIILGGLEVYKDLFNQYPYSTLGQNTGIVLFLSLAFAVFIFLYALAFILYFFLNVYVFVDLYNPIASKYFK